MVYPRGNLFANAEPPIEGERFEFLGDLGGVRIEQIVSSARPELVEYDQAHDEWVVLLSGTAELEVAGQRLCMREGDYVLLPAHTRHRVLATSRGARWLAVHGSSRPS